MNRQMEDVSLQLNHAQVLCDFLTEEMNSVPPMKPGVYYLSKVQIEAYQWILSDIGNLLYTINQAVCPEEAREKGGDHV